MKSYKKVFLCLFLLLLVLPMQVFAGGEKEMEEEKKEMKVEESYIRLGWWGNPTRDERTLAVSDMYMKMYPNVVIEPETTGWPSYWERINTQVASGSLPDLMQHDYAYMLQFVQRDLLKDLTPYVKSGVIDLSNVNDTFISGGKVDGGLYGISLGTNAVCLAYNTKILADAGISKIDSAKWTWNDFEKIATTIYEKTGVQTNPFFVTDPKVGFDNMIRQTGASTFAKDGTSLGFTDPTVLKEFFNIQLRLLEKGVMVNPEKAFVTVTPEEGDMAKEKVWCDYVWSNQVVFTQKVVPNPVGVALLPKIKNGKRPGTFLKPSMFFAIPDVAENPDEAAKLLSFFIGNEEATYKLGTDRGIPIKSNIRQNLQNQADETNKKVFEFIGLVGDNSSPIDPPDPDGTGEVLKIFRDTTQEILNGTITVDAGVSKFMKSANEILAKNK